MRRLFGRTFPKVRAGVGGTPNSAKFSRQKKFCQEGVVPIWRKNCPIGMYVYSLTYHLFCGEFYFNFFSYELISKPIDVFQQIRHQEHCCDEKLVSHDVVFLRKHGRSCTFILKRTLYTIRGCSLFINDVIISSGYPWFLLQTTHRWSEVKTVDTRRYA